MIINYLVNRRRTHPLLVVRYEDLKEDRVKHVQRMLSFLNVTVSETELVQRLQPDQFNEFHRNHSEQSSFDPYTSSQVEYLNSIITETEHILSINGVTHFPLKPYTRPQHLSL